MQSAVPRIHVTAAPIIHNRIQNQPGKEPHHVDSPEVALVQHGDPRALAAIGPPGPALTPEQIW
jgi:hypothetical protein